MFRYIIPVIAAVALGAGLASAADIPQRSPAPAPAPEPAPIFTWTGFYVGVNLGGAGARSSSTGIPGAGFLGPFDDFGAASSVSLRRAGAVGGAQIGYNYQVNNFVMGVEAEFGYLGLQRSRTWGDNFASVKYGAFGTATARLGVVAGRSLLYVKGGVALARIRNTASDLDGVPLIIDPTDYSSIRSTRTGWTVGVGLEHAISNRWSLRTEYQYMDFGKKSSGNLDGDLFSHRNRVHMFRFGLNYLYNSVGGPVMAKY